MSITRRALSALGKIAPIALTFGLLALFVAFARERLDLQRLLAYLANISPHHALAAFVCFNVGYAGAALRFWQIARKAGLPPMGRRSMLGLTQATYLASYLAPVGAVSDILRVAFLRFAMKAELLQSAAVVVYDRLLGMAGVAAVGLVFLPLQAGSDLPPAFLALQALGWTGILVCFAALGPIGRWLASRLGDRSATAQEIARTAHVQMSTLNDLAIQLAFALLAVGGFGGAIASLALSVAPSAAPLLFLSLAPLILVVQNLPFIYAGWGAREGAFIMLAGLIAGADVNALLALSIAVGAGLVVVALPGALLFLVFATRKLHLNWRDMRTVAG
ncbi:MAG: lysylphosphatidylglycerol synthase transmembrane domain-containing protein [Caulobacteraceae bacterium]